MRHVTKILSVLLTVWAGPVAAQDLIGSYTAVIGTDDLYNSNGARLTEPWQVLRQDRANYHRFGIRQPGDEWDPFFGDIDNRAAMERMILQGRIDPVARRALMQGGRDGCRAHLRTRQRGNPRRGERGPLTARSYRRRRRCRAWAAIAAASRR